MNGFSSKHHYAFTPIFLACEAGESIKAGALAPGPRDVTNQPVTRAQAADFQAFARFAGCFGKRFLPGAAAPGFMLSPASQAEEQLNSYFLCKAVWEHRTPKGVRNRLMSDDYKHTTPIGVNQVLLIRLAFVFQPTCDVSSLRIVVCPVNDSALRIPNVLAVKADVVAFL